MQHIHTIQQYVGCDVGYNDSTIRPTKSVHNVGCSGLNKHLSFEEVLNIAYTIHHPRPNIIVKAGKNAKWYLKYCPEHQIDMEIVKQKKWRDTSRAKMYAITWLETNSNTSVHY